MRSRDAFPKKAVPETDGGGKLIFHIFAALAEFERKLIRERTWADGQRC